MKRLFFLFILGSFCLLSLAQKTTVLQEDIRSAQLIAMGDPLLQPILELGKRWTLDLHFDQMSHTYHRYLYKVELCNADWTVNDEVFESDYLSGMNNQPIEDYEKSFNTTQIYTHYRLQLPNENCRLRMAGNYRITVCDEDEPDEPVLTSEFCLCNNLMSINAEVSSNTDIDFNQRHQQLSFSVGYGQQRVVDPAREIKTVVMQNHRQDTRRTTLVPNIQKTTGIEFTHNRELVFTAGNEFHKFEILDVHKPNMNVDFMRWYDPYYHATLIPDYTRRNYSFEQDQNGAFVIRNSEDEDNETTCEYVVVHFTLQSEHLDGGDVYVYGDWANDWPNDAYRMTYDQENKQYEVGVLLKQGYYDYQFLQVAEDGSISCRRTDGEFFEAENEYTILVYHRPQGGRYDQLVGYRKLKTRK